MSPTKTKKKRMVPAGTPQGFDAYGHHVNYYRRANALRHLRQMAPEMTTGDATLLIDSVSDFIARDMPYEADARANEAGLDMTGAIRLMAVLMTPAPEEYIDG